jgi:hypothetical protein
LPPVIESAVVAHNKNLQSPVMGMHNNKVFAITVWPLATKRIPIQDLHYISGTIFNFTQMAVNGIPYSFFLTCKIIVFSRFSVEKIYL